MSSRLATLSDSARLDSQVLLAFILDKPRAWVLAHPESKLSSEQASRLESALVRLERGEPLPYVLGHWEFFGLDFNITPDVLIPRPETELLVERCVEWLETHPTRRWIAEIGTGSGCIPVSIAKRISDLKIVSTDISLPALKVAQSNLRKHRVADQVFLVQSDMLQGINPSPHRRFDLICSNPPYIPESILKTLPVSRWEPRLALSGGESGMHQINRILEEALSRLAPAGCLLIEIESSMGNAIRARTQQVFPQVSATVFQDLAGKDRLVQVELPLTAH